MTELISRTGRVQSWIDEPDGRLPVSCTIHVPEDSFDGPDGLNASFKFVTHGLRYGAGVAVHLSKLRPKGTESPRVTASGPVSFGRIYNVINDVVRRGGSRFKKGAVVLHLDLNHPDILDFITASRAELPWVKRCVNITDDWWNDTPSDTKQALIKGIRAGDIWLGKVKYDINGKRIRLNVCLEVYLPSRGSCLLSHVNLAACDFIDIPRAFEQGMTELCELHGKTGVGDQGEYLKPEVDRQVGLGMLGLAQLLARYDVTYSQFGRALEQVNNGEELNSPAFNLALQLKSGIDVAAKIAKDNNMDRAFAIAPTASCSYRSKSLEGFTATPEIAPPIARSVDRDSGTEGVINYQYGECEIASEVGWDAFKKVADNIMTMLDRTELLHGYSFNWWSDMVTMDEEFIEEWLGCPQTSLYYSLQVMSNTQDKSSVYAALDETEVEDYLEGLLNEPLQCDCQE